MIVNDQKNIKVHFAGLENQDFAMALTDIGDIKYSLFTVFPFIAHKFGIKPLKMKSCTTQSPGYLTSAHRHTIMDSGLFTLMFGAHAGERDEKFVTRWLEELVGFTEEVGYTGTIVEVDCQKILGVEKAWEFRKRMREMTNLRQINVFHKEDGKKGLDRLIEFSDYIAVSVPELRITNRKTYKEDVVRLANYIKNKKPSIDIHLLGCTENNLLKQCSFCSSADSTSWQQVNRWGSLVFNHGDKTTKVKNRDINKAKLEGLTRTKVENILQHFEMEVTPKRLDYYGKYGLAGMLLKKQYAYYGGNQE